MERIKAHNLEDKEMTQSHIWLARVWLGEDLILTGTYNTKAQGEALRKPLKSSHEKYRVTVERIDFDGDWIL